MKPTRAALYARCSTGHQDVGLQVDELRAVAAHRGFTLVHEYVDEGVSGATTSRPGFDAMMKAAQAGKFEHLLVWKLDRLGRSLPHLLNSLDLLAGWGVSFCSVRDPGVDTTSAHGRLLLQLLAVFASYERELIKERVTAGVRRAQAAGRHVGVPAQRFYTLKCLDIPRVAPTSVAMRSAEPEVRPALSDGLAPGVFDRTLLGKIQGMRQFMNWGADPQPPPRQGYFRRGSAASGPWAGRSDSVA